jgi:type IV pilus assembly protein PilM
MRQYGMSQEEAEAAKRSGGLPENYEAEVLRPFMENAALEIQRAMQFFFTSTQYTSVEHVLLTGGSAVIPGLDEMVQSRTQINALVANPFANMAISPRVPLKKLVSDAPSLMVACGLAMRRFDQ